MILKTCNTVIASGKKADHGKVDSGAFFSEVSDFKDHEKWLRLTGPPSPPCSSSVCIRYSFITELAQSCGLMPK